MRGSFGILIDNFINNCWIDNFFSQAGTVKLSLLPCLLKQVLHSAFSLLRQGVSFLHCTLIKRLCLLLRIQYLF